MRKNLKSKTIVLIIIILTIGINAQNALSIQNQKNDRIFDIKIKSMMYLANHGAISTCIIKNDTIVWEKNYGYSHPYQLKKANNQTIYGVGSITKTITTTAILQLYEKGLIDLKDDINKYLPFEIRNPNYPDIPITIESLITHRSSNQDYYIMTPEGRDTIQRLYLNKYFNKENPLPDSTLYWLKEALIPGGKYYKDECWFDFPPNNKTAYSTMGFLIATAVIENVTKQTIEEYCQKNIFQPLEMKNTSYHPYILDKKQIARAFLGTKILKIPIMHYDTGCLAGGGGIRTTLNDISHYLIMNLNNGKYKNKTILNETTMEKMHNTTYPDEIYTKWHPYTHGYAWYETEEYGEKLIGHGGGAVGYDCMIVMNKTTKTAIALLSTKLVSRMLYNLNYVLAHDSRIKIIKLILEKSKEYN